MIKQDNESDHALSQLSRLLSRLELPRCELPYFDGSPLEYVRFFRQFEEQIETQVTDNSQRLTYLYHYCQGKAKDAINGCLLYPAAEGYNRARVILKDLFGQRHLVVRAMLDEVTSPGSVSASAEDLLAYANKLVTCADTLEQLGYVADLNSVSTIERVLDKLPRFVAIDWVKMPKRFTSTSVNLPFEIYASLSLLNPGYKTTAIAIY